MSNEIWEKVTLKQNTRRTAEPVASIGQGRISLNPNACDLIDNIYNYEWVEVMQAKENGRVTKIGLKFADKKEQNLLHAVRRKYKGKVIDGLNINSKEFIKRYFGTSKEKTTGRYSVSKLNSDYKTLVIDISREI